ncbi:MAG TPA: hypothetical protein VEC60_02335 [Reyranella sp.]|nr:hypothetical protein [Reyranella sp.]
MFFRRRLLLILVHILAIGLAAPRASADKYYDWNRYVLQGLPDQSEWAAYFRENARIRLGREQRLPNGVSWRLFTELRSGISIPRLTWMPDRQRLQTANRLLDMVHGGEMVAEALEREQIDSGNIYAAKRGWPPLVTKHALEQGDVGLTYVGSRLMSLMWASQIATQGNHPDALLRGITFDLDDGSVHHVRPCPDSHWRYGFKTDYRPGNFQFEYGALLRLCDTTSYRNFIALVKEIDDARPVRHLTPSASDKAQGCTEYPDLPLVREEQEYVLYLTFSGLAVQVSGSECPARRRPDNPIIVPYRRLEPFMLPGPWRDELLGLR